MESQPQNPEFRSNLENFHPWARYLIFGLSLHLHPNFVYEQQRLWGICTNAQTG